MSWLFLYLQKIINLNNKKMKNGDYVIAPLGCAEYLTAGNRYEVFEVYKSYVTIFFCIYNDMGEESNCLSKGCEHLNGQDWILATESEAFLKEVEEPTSDFLEKNGFELIEKGVYHNDKAMVILYDDYYAVLNFEDNGINYSDNLNIYWLVGYLTYYNLIDKDYKK